MENNSDSSADKFLTYSECLRGIFDKIKRNIAKKHSFYQELTTVCKNIEDNIQQDKGKSLNADKYFLYIKWALEGDNLKMIEGILEYLQRLVKDDLLLGQSEDLEGKKEPSHFYPGQLKRKLVDSIVDTVVNLFNLSDENIWLNCVKLFYTMYRNPNTRIHNESLSKIFKFCVRVFLSSRTNINCDTAKSCLNQMITQLFSKMEAMNAFIISRESAMPLTSTNDEKESLGYLSQFTTISGRSFSIRPSENFISRQTSSSNNSNSVSLSVFTSGNILYRNPVDDMCGKIVKNLVDDVCLYLAKIGNENTDKNPNYANKTENYTSISNANKSNYIDYPMQFPLRSTPYCSPENMASPIFSLSKLYSNSGSPPAAYHKLTNPFIENEKGEVSGNFGWCLICRSTAHFYCKDSRYPICSFECKTKLQNEDAKISKHLKGELTSEDDLALVLFKDAVSIFNSLCKLLITNVSSKNEAFNSRAKVIALELILSVLEKPGSAFLTQKEFIHLVKEDLIQNLLINCVSEEINLFSLSLSVFFKIWLNFREHLKTQIAVFIETVFLKILDSGNSSFNHKWCVLDNFYKQAGSPRFFVELYVNYDCELGEKDLLNQIVFSLSKISQGKYNRSEHMLSPQQEYSLRTRALEILTMMVRTILMFSQEQVGWTAPRLRGLEDGQEERNMMTNTGTNVTIGDDFLDDASYLDTTQIDSSSLKEKLDQNRKIKYDISTAVDKFNIKIKTGLQYLKKIGLVSKTDKEEEAKDIANFLKNSHGLKKTHIGDYIGEMNEVAIKTLSYFVDTFNFQKTGIVDALRELLSFFHLPGEGQKIDRIIEKFAAKFYKDNPEVYATADCAYYVAFSIIMLQTSIHNPNVKNKMTLEEFAKMLKGMNGGKDLELAYLADIYNQIQTKSISLKELEEAKDKIDTNKKKTELFKKETERMYQEGTEKLKKGIDKLYLKVCEIEHIAPLMDSIWTALLAMYSLILEDSDDSSLDLLCVEGISNCVKLCGMLNLDLQKEALLKGFCKMTNLFQGKEIKDKHILCIKSILSLANIDGRFLKGCWHNVLELISKIDYYHMVICGSKSELEGFFNEIRLKKRTSVNVDREILVEKINMERIAKEISQDDYEIIYNKTVLLDQQSIVDFVKSLCEISREELAVKENARIFSLQKLVEVAEFNMNRVRIVWANIWTIISEHLTEVGSNPSPVVAEKAVDSLRQLAKKFLQKDEISVYQFQKDFLKPFENILVNNINMYRTKEYVITCITNLVLAEAPSIKSGWRIIFNIFQLAAEDSQKDIIRKTFDTICRILDNHFSQVKDNFPELAHCLKKFASSYPEEVVNIFFQTYYKIDERDETVVFALLTSLATIVSDQRENVRRIASDKLFGIISNVLKNLVKTKRIAGDLNKSEDWDLTIMKGVIKPVIDDLIANKYDSTLELVLMNMVDLLETNEGFKKMINEFLSDLAGISADQNEAIAIAGIKTLKYIISKNKIFTTHQFDFWEGICSTVSDIFNKTKQTGLLELDINNFNSAEYQQKYQDIVFNNIVYCIVQHNMIELCDYIITSHIQSLKLEECLMMLDCLRDSFTLAYKFNIEFNLRKLISFHFMSDLSQIAALFKQQQDGIALYFKILNLLNQKDDENTKAICRKKMLIISHSILKDFIERMDFQIEESNPNGQYLVLENERLLKNMVPALVEHIIPSMLNIDFGGEKDYLNDFAQIFLQLIPCGVLEVRLMVKKALARILEKITSI